MANRHLAFKSPTNEDRAACIDVIRAAYCDFLLQFPDEADIRDILSDIMHWCRREGVDFQAELALARNNFEEEVREE